MPQSDMSEILKSAEAQEEEDQVILRQCNFNDIVKVLNESGLGGCWSHSSNGISKYRVKQTRRSPDGRVLMTFNNNTNTLTAGAKNFLLKNLLTKAASEGLGNLVSANNNKSDSEEPSSSDSDDDPTYSMSHSAANPNNMQA